jgi:hypothetical protein
MRHALCNACSKTWFSEPFRPCPICRRPCWRNHARLPVRERVYGDTPVAQLIVQNPPGARVLLLVRFAMLSERQRAAVALRMTENHDALDAAQRELREIAFECALTPSADLCWEVLHEFMSLGEARGDASFDRCTAALGTLAPDALADVTASLSLKADSDAPAAECQRARCLLREARRLAER